MSRKEPLRIQAERARYRLRASFYYRMHEIWLKNIKALEEFKTENSNWDNYLNWGISEAAWECVKQKETAPCLVFCHPDLITQHPLLVTYYRCLALIPQKGVNHLLGFSTKSLEEQTRKSRPGREQAEKLACLFNNSISLLIESDPKWTLEKARVAALLNLGSQINGSWRNEIGEEGGRRIKELLIVNFQRENLIKSFVLLDDKGGVSAGETQALENIKGFVTKNDYRVLFGSEPDVSIFAPGKKEEKETLLATIEVKYGLDPAGALERYGAAKKSFEHAVKKNARVVNIYLASCLTPEVMQRIKEDRVVNMYFDLTEILGDSAKRQEFLKHIHHLMSF